MDRHSTALPATRVTGDLGAAGEHLAVAHLEGDGFVVAARNWRRRHGEVRGELDVVALDRATRSVVVVEVKTRRSQRHGGPLSAVTATKQARIRSLTAAMLQELDLPYRRVRLDVVGILLPPHGPGRLVHVPGAF